MKIDRAYSLLTIKSINEDERIITGMASTPTTDRMGDVVEPKGAQFSLPLPLLWQHDSSSPIGQVIKAKVTPNGIEIIAQVAKGVLEDIDEAWALIKAGLVRGLSIGFRAMEYEPVDPKEPYGGVRFIKWDWLELSAVTIPANAEATIQTIKSMDAEQLRTASGAKRERSGASVVRLTTPGVPGQSVTTRGTQMNLQQQIAAFEAKRAANQARLQELMKTAAEDGNRTLDVAEEKEYDDLEAEVTSIDGHLKRLRALEKSMVSTATTVRPQVEGTDPVAAAVQRTGSSVVWGKSALPKGTAFVRYAIALAASKGVRSDALDFASRWKDSTPEVVNCIRDNVGDLVQRSAMTAGSTTDSDWANPLVIYDTMASEFIDLLRPQTILGKMSSLRRVPFNIRVAGKTQGSTVGWTGQGAPKPVSELKFNEVTLGFAKAAGIVVISQELARFSNPAAEALIRTDMLDTMSQFLDEQFIDPSVAAVANVSPAAVTQGILSQRVTSTGATVALVTADVKSIFDLFATADLSTQGCVWVMRPQEAVALSMLRTSQDLFVFPNINADGGSWFGYPVITSTSVPNSASGGAIIAFVKQNEVFVADDGGVRIDVSEQASLQMDSAPSAGAQSLVSLWQNNLVGIRAERFINWQRRRDTAVAYIDAVHY